MEWTQVLTIIVALLGGVFYIHNDVREFRKEMHQQNTRIDKLYKMFIDLLRKQKK